MNVGILGLGLIGGSMARAYSKVGHRVYAAERDASIHSFAELTGAIHGALNAETLPACDLILLAIYPKDCISWLEENAGSVSKSALVLDLCGIKEEICKTCFAIAERHGFTFVGGHPMAGSHNSGFKYSRSNLFQGAPMVLVPPKFDDIQLLDRVKTALAPCNFGSFSICTAQEHDRWIAFTSQMPHVLSNAYIKSPTAATHRGFSAGSYKDLTRVAWLNPKMWAELLMNNKEHVINELDVFIAEMQKYKTAIENNDTALLETLLEEGKRHKEEIDG